MTGINLLSSMSGKVSICNSNSILLLIKLEGASFRSHLEETKKITSRLGEEFLTFISDQWWNVGDSGKRKQSSMYLLYRNLETERMYSCRPEVTAFVFEREITYVER